MSLLDLSQNLPNSLTFSSGFKSIVRNAMQLTSQEVLIEDGVVVMRVTMNGIARDSGIATWARVYRKRLGEVETAIRLDSSVASSKGFVGFVCMQNTAIHRYSECTITLDVGLPDNHGFLENKLCVQKSDVRAPGVPQ